MAASNVTWLNSCVNPIIYAMMNTRFRKGKKFYKKSLQKFQKISKIIIQKSEYFNMLKHLIKARTSHQSEKSVHRRVSLWVSPKTYV